MAAKTLSDAVTALETARAGGVIDMEVEQQVIVLLLQALGVDVDLEAMRERIDQAKAEEEEAAKTEIEPYSDLTTEGLLRTMVDAGNGR